MTAEEQLQQYLLQKSASAILDHVAKEDPHSQYTTEDEASALAPVQSVNNETGDVVTTLDKVTEQGANSSRLISCGGKVALTPDGGIAVLLTNKTGAPSVKGEVVTVNTTVSSAVEKIVVDNPNPIGVFYESDVADGLGAWVVVSGIADAYFVGDTAPGHIARGFLGGDSGYVVGQVMSEVYPVAPFASDKHFYEIGHVLESRVGPGLAKVVLHFN